MKKWLKILLIAVTAILLVTVFAACDPKEPATPGPDPSAEYTLTFDSKGGDIVQPIKAKAGEDISALLPQSPTKNAVYFKCWSEEDNGFGSAPATLPTTMPAQNVTYYAVWARHYTIIPRLQGLESGEPNTTYTENRDLAVTYEADPSRSSVDLKGKAPAVVGYYESSPEEDYVKTLTAKDNDIFINYDLRLYSIAFAPGNGAADGEMDKLSAYFGGEIELPRYGFELDDFSLRFAGWSADLDGNSFAEAGDKIVIGGEFIDGQNVSVTLSAVYDKGYRDYSNGDDFLFLPEREQGVAIICRGGVTEFEGTYTQNANVSGEASFIGSFDIPMDSGATLEGRVYKDGHFAYAKNTLSSSLFRVEYPAVDIKTGMSLDGTSVELNDSYGSATLTLGESMTFKAINDEDYTVESVTLEAGAHVGGYWDDALNQDFCFSMMVTVEDTELQLDIHFNLYRFTSGQGEPFLGVALRGNETGMYCEDLEDGYMTGNRILIDGYGTAMLYDENDAQWVGEYIVVNDGDILFGVWDEDDNYFESIIRPDYDDVLGTNMMRISIMTYREGDSATYARCENSDTGERFESDGFGNGTYYDEDGMAHRGQTTLGAEAFSTASPAIVYILEDGAEKFDIIVDHSDRNGKFIVRTGDVDVHYLYSESSTANDYLGAIVELENEAYFFDAVISSSGSTVFSSPEKGAVTNANGTYLFAGDHRKISFKDDAARTEKNGIPTYTTAQIDFSTLTFTVKDLQGKDAGTLSVDANGKAKYTVGAEVKFENKACQYAYSSMLVEDNGLFVIDSYGAPGTALLTEQRTLRVAGVAEAAGEVFECYGEITRAMLWAYDEDGRLLFYNFGLITSSEGVYTITLSNNDTIQAKKQSDAYLARNNALAEGTFTNGDNKLELDYYGTAKFTAGSAAAIEGAYAYEDGTYKVTFEGANEGSSFRFIFGTTRGTYTPVSYREYPVVNPSTGSISNFLRIYDDNTATLYRTAGSGDQLHAGTQPTASGTVRKLDGTDEETWLFSNSASEEIFKFYFNDELLSSNAVVRSVSSLKNGEYAGENNTSLKLDDLGRATYTDEKGEHKGMYSLNGGRFAFVGSDTELDFRFTVDDAGNTFSLFDPNRKPAENGTYEITYEGETYTLDINFSTLAFTLSQGGTQVATDIADLSNGVYSIVAYTDEGDLFDFTFMIVDGKYLAHNDDLDFTLDILSGNVYLHEQSIGSIDGNQLTREAGTLTVRGFLQSATLTNGNGVTLNGVITPASFGSNLSGYTFISNEGSTQDLVLRTDRSGRQYLAALGVEAGYAYNYFVTMGVFDQEPVISFDGLGRANDGTSRTLYYYFGANPNDPEDTTDYIYVVTISGDDVTPVAIYKPYQLAAEGEDGNIMYALGVVRYNPVEDAVVLADDGTLFSTNGFDEVSYYDSLGVYHSGYYNNYGEIAGARDSSYVVFDEMENMTVYYIYFEDREDDELFVRAKRVTYMISFGEDAEAFSGMQAMLQLVSKEDYREFTGTNFPASEEEKGMDGYAIISVYDSAGNGMDIVGFYKLNADEGTVTVYAPHVYNDSAVEDDLLLIIYIDGFAEWYNAADSGFFDMN